VRAARRATGTRLEQEVERRRVTVERGARAGAEAAATRVVPADVQGEDVAVEAHEHVRRRREHVRFAETRAEAVVRRLRLEDAQRGPLAELGQVAPQLKPRCDPRGRRSRSGEQRQNKGSEAYDRDQSMHRARL
jgi:hypothetical protein